MTILSTDLRALKRRGYNGKLSTIMQRTSHSHYFISLVDRILKKQRADREAAERVRQEQAREAEKLLSDLQPSGPTHMPPVMAGSTTTNQPGSDRELPAVPTEGSNPVLPTTQRPLSSLSTQLQTWKRKFANQPTKGEPSKPGVSDAQAGPSSMSRPSTPDVAPDSSVRTNNIRPTSPEPHQSPSMPGALPVGPLPGLPGGARDPIARRPRGSSGQITSLNSIGTLILLFDPTLRFVAPF